MYTGYSYTPNPPLLSWCVRHQSLNAGFLKNLSVKGLGGRCLRLPPPPGFVWGGKAICEIWSNTQWITPVSALNTNPPPPPPLHPINNV
jgi:hypothetical protein